MADDQRSCADLTDENSPAAAYSRCTYSVRASGQMKDLKLEVLDSKSDSHQSPPPPQHDRSRNGCKAVPGHAPCNPTPAHGSFKRPQPSLIGVDRPATSRESHTASDHSLSDPPPGGRWRQGSETKWGRIALGPLAFSHQSHLSGSRKAHGTAEAYSHRVPRNHEPRGFPDRNHIMMPACESGAGTAFPSPRLAIAGATQHPARQPS